MPTLLQALAEPHDAAEAVHHPEPVRRGHADQQAAVVGAEVDGGERGRAWPSVLGCFSVCDHVQVLPLSYMGLVSVAYDTDCKPNVTISGCQVNSKQLLTFTETRRFGLAVDK